MTLKERIKQFIDCKGLTSQQFEQLAGLSNGAVSKMGDGTRRSTLEKVSNIFPDLNLTWLLTGEGEMLRDNATDTADPSTAPKLIPLYDAETTGGFDGLVAASTEVAIVKGYINAGDWFDRRETAAIRHVGESMVEYPDGCILAVREVRDPRLLVPGRNYVIETDEYRITKRVQKGSESGFITLYSTNPEKYDDGRLVYEPFEVHLADVRHIYTILGYVVTQCGDAQLIKA